MTVETFVIPELEVEAARYRRRDWTDEQIETLKKYWRRVPKRKLEKAVKHGGYAVDRMASELGLPPWGSK